MPYAPTNSLIISAREDRLAHILEIVRALDLASATTIAVLPLRYADAGPIANQVDVALLRDAKPDEPLRVVVDERTNSLVVQGAPERVAEVRDYVELRRLPSRARRAASTSCAS